MVSVLGFSAAISILMLASAFYMLEVFDRVLTSRSMETLILLTLITVGATIIMGILDSLRLRILVRVGMRMADMLASRALRAMVSINSQNGGMTVRTGLRDIETIRNFIGSAGFAALIDAPFAIILLTVLAFLHLVYLAIVVGGGAILLGLAMANSRWSSPITVESLGMA